MPPERILLVDDEEELIKAMRIRLTSWGYDVLTATNGREALRLIKKEVPDVVILDIVMPDMDGIEVLRRIRRFDKNTPVLMFTAYSNEERMKLSNEFGISGFIPKGAEATDASEAIRIILKGVKKCKNGDKKNGPKKNISS